MMLEQVVEGVLRGCVLSAEQCAELVRGMAQGREWRPAAVTRDGGKTYKVEECRRQEVLVGLAAEEELVVRQAMAWARAGAVTLTGAKLELVQVEIMRGGVGSFFDWHRDGGRGSRRAVSALVCLQAPEEGGETEFEVGTFTYAARHRPGCGLLFDARARHCGRVVTAGEKYALQLIFES